MAKQLNRQAYSILTEKEKLILNLQHVEEKSSWTAGEIMSLAHYKLLEIQYRANHFIRLFSEHFELFDDLIPKGTTGTEEVKDYFRLTIGQRKTIKDTYDLLNSKYGFSGKNTREKEIEEQMILWGQSENAHDLTTYNLIKEFDRWNNFRILPPSLREPSAFKRRNKNILKKHIRVTTNIPDISVGKIEQLFGYKKGSKPVYLPVITQSGKVVVFKLKSTKDSIDQLTSLNLYLFTDNKLATEYIELVRSYATQGVKKCKVGLEFWPKYRDMIKRAINYEPIQKIVPSRKYLQLALKKLTFH